MRGFWAIWKREMLSLFVTPTAWIVIFLFVLFQGMHFYVLVEHFATSPEVSADQGPVQAFFGGDIFYYLPLILICPGLTMRLFAEERRAGTIETLLTAPVSTPSIVLGKYLAAVATYAAMWAPTILYVVVLRKAGDIDWHVVGTSYLGVLLLGAGWLAIGTLMSALTTSQLVAMVLSGIAIVALFLVGVGAMIFDPGPAHDVCAYVSVWDQVQEMAKGIVDLRRVVWDLTLVALPLFVTARAVDAWRWG